jgi:hypothetical protein
MHYLFFFIYGHYFHYGHFCNFCTVSYFQTLHTHVIHIGSGGLHVANQFFSAIAMPSNDDYIYLHSTQSRMEATKSGEKLSADRPPQFALL